MSQSDFSEVRPRAYKETSKGTPALEANRTGKVILVDKSGTRKTVEGCYFSNVDYLYYDAESNPHPILEQLRGKKFALKYQLKEQDRHSKELFYEGILLSPTLLGEMGPIDWKHMSEAEKLGADFSVKSGGSSGYRVNHKKDFLQGAASSYIVMTAPDVDYTKVKALIVHLSFVLIIDEQFDNSNWYKGHKAPMANIRQVADKIMQVFRFEKDPEEQETDFDFPLMKPLCRHAAYLRDDVKAKASTEQIFQRYVSSMSDYLAAVTLNNCREWNDFKVNCKTGTDQRAHWDIRRLDSGCQPYFDVVMSDYGSQLPQEIYESHLWQAFRKLAVDNIALVNDIFSYRKEIFDKETCNALIVRHFDEGMEFVEAAQLCIGDANKAAMDMIQLGEMLLKLYDNEENLKKEIYLLKAVTFGHMLWYNYALIYHNGIVFDCVIYEDDDVMLEQLKIQ